MVGMGRLGVGWAVAPRREKSNPATGSKSSARGNKRIAPPKVAIPLGYRGGGINPSMHAFNSIIF